MSAARADGVPTCRRRRWPGIAEMAEQAVQQQGQVQATLGELAERVAAMEKILLSVD
ncbi:hypothetical protein [Nonomuraea sp. NPDC052265]|uniref:hypothetical protein n=1 Tax=Nonomuraea sp. NPDC052265 TaxID=3364374 RepID=UPI0037CAABC0